ncbi:MAG: TolC family protein [Acidobacteriota bacterium]
MKWSAAAGVLVSSLLVILAATQTSAPATTLRLEEAIRLALDNHPRLRQARQRVEAARSRVTQARSTFFPQIDAGGVAKQGLSGSGGAFRLKGLASSPNPDDLAVSANFYQDLLDFGRTRSAQKARSWELAFFVEETRVETGLVIKDVTTAYLELLKARKQIELVVRTIAEKELALKQAEAFHNAQLRSGLDVALARTGLDRARLDRAHARSAEKQGRARLRNAMGIPSDSVRYLLQEPSLDARSPGPLGPLVQEATRSHPELKAVDAGIAAREAWLHKAEAELRPRIMGLFSGGWTRFSRVAIGNFLFGGFGIRMPLFTGKNLRAQVEEARRDLERARAERDETSLRIRLQVETSFYQLLDLIESAGIYQQLLVQARKAAKGAEIRNRVGLEDSLEVAKANLNLARTENEYAGFLYDYKITEAELNYAIGRGTEP